MKDRQSDVYHNPESGDITIKHSANLIRKMGEIREQLESLLKLDNGDLSSHKLFLLRIKRLYSQRLENIFHKQENSPIEAAVEMFEICLELEDADLINRCFNCLTECGKDITDCLIRKYSVHKNSLDRRNVWLELLAKLGIKDARIRDIIEEHLRYDRVTAVQAIGDYGDGYFIPILEEILNETADNLRGEEINPHQRYSRLLSRNANLYIEAKSAYIALKHKCKPNSKRYRELSQRLDKKLLPFIYKKVDATEIGEDIKVCCDRFRESASMENSDYYINEALIIYLTTRSILSDGFGVRDFFETLGLMVRRLNREPSPAFNDYYYNFLDRTNFVDEAHYLQAMETIDNALNYLQTCFRQNCMEAIDLLLDMFSCGIRERNDFFRESTVGFLKGLFIHYFLDNKR